MKFRILLLSAFFIGMIQTMQAQTDTPDWPGIDVKNVIGKTGDAGEVYLYNVGQGMYLRQGGTWGTSIQLSPIVQSLLIMSPSWLPKYKSEVAGGTECSLAIRGLYERKSRCLGYKDDMVYTDLTGHNTIAKPFLRFTLIPQSLEDGKLNYNLFCYTNINGWTMTYTEKRLLGCDTNNSLNTKLNKMIKYNAAPSVSDLTNPDNLWRIVTRQELIDLMDKQRRVGDPLHKASFMLRYAGFERQSEQALIDEAYGSSTSTTAIWKASPHLRFNVGASDKSDMLAYTNKADNKSLGKYWYAEIGGPSPKQGNTNYGSFTQKVRLFKPGWYKVTCNGFYRQGRYKGFHGLIYAREFVRNTWQGSYLNTIDPADNIVNRFDAAKALYEGRYAGNSVTIYLPDNDSDPTNSFSQELEIGIMGVNEGTTKAPAYDKDEWIAVDNFRLLYMDQNTMALNENSTDVSVINKQVRDQIVLPLMLKRTITPNVWNTLMLPVALNAKQFRSAFDDDAMLAKFNGASQTKAATIDFRTVDVAHAADNAIVLEPNTMYLLKTINVGNRTFEGKLLQPVIYTDNSTGTVEFSQDYFFIEDVHLDNSVPENGILRGSPISLPMSGQSDNIYACGSYNAHTDRIVPINAYVTSKDGRWYRTERTFPVKGFRCWIETSASGAAPAKLSFQLDGVEDNSFTTAIQDVLGNDYQSEGIVYNLNGQVVRKGTLDGLPTGVYILNGKKHIVK